MVYNFDAPVNRRHTNSLKWDVAENELPMWVADMDFETAPEIKAAIAARAAHGVFGYTVIPDAWAQAYIDWWADRHGYLMEKDWLVFCTGVIPAISSLVRKLTTPAEKVLIQTPVYNIFFNSILNNGRQVLQGPLQYDGSEYSIDFADLEQKLADPQTTLMLLCNPHNPTGKIWSKETLAQIGSLCYKHHVTVIADEIHCDITAPGRDYIPFASVSEECRENSVTCIAPTKTFNIAGLQTAAVSVPNAALRHKVWRALNTDEIAEPSAFAVDAAIAAYTKGAAWLNALREYVHDNKTLAAEYVRAEIPHAQAAPSEATYLLWLDCTRIRSFSAPEAAAFIRKETGLYVSEGAQFGGNGAQFLRINAACPRASLRQGLILLKKGLAAYENTTACG